METLAHWVVGDFLREVYCDVLSPIHPTPPIYGPGFEMGGNAMDSGLSQTWQMRSVKWAVRDELRKGVCSASRWHCQSLQSMKVCSQWPLSCQKHQQFGMGFTLLLKQRKVKGISDRHCSKAKDCAIEVCIKGIKRLKAGGTSHGDDSFPMNRLQTPVRLKEHKVVCSSRSCNFSDSPDFSCLLSAPKPEGPTGWD